MSTKISAEKLKAAKEMYKNNKKISVEEVAIKLNLKPVTLSHIWSQVTGITKKQRKDAIIAKAKKMYEKDPDIDPGKIAKKVDRSRGYILMLWKEITGHKYSRSNETGSGLHVYSASEDLPISIRIPEFVPKAKPFVDRDGKMCQDVSEFFGITENGGECYKNVHYTIPECTCSQYDRSLSDFYI